jgi:hypothetical protein
MTVAALDADSCDSIVLAAKSVTGDHMLVDGCGYHISRNEILQFVIFYIWLTARKHCWLVCILRMV